MYNITNKQKCEIIISQLKSINPNLQFDNVIDEEYWDDNLAFLRKKRNSINSDYDNKMDKIKVIHRLFERRKLWVRSCSIEQDYNANIIYQGHYYRCPSEPHRFGKRK